MAEKTDEQIKENVRQKYGELARQHLDKGRSEPAGQSRRAGCCTPGQASSCCGPAREARAAPAAVLSFYPAEEVAGLPETVTEASLGCGNPLAIADLRPGEVVLDLGSGGGIDCFLAARRLGPEGRVIGLDMTPDMLRLARRNARKLGLTNVEFQWGEMEEIPLPDASVDVVISNCVINLSPDKDAVFAEAFRVLRPGGRLSVSDIVIDGDLPAAIRQSLDAWVGCVAGALDQEVYLDKMRAAGFVGIEVLSRDAAAHELVDCGVLQVEVVGPDGRAVSGDEARALLDEAGLSAAQVASKIASIKVRARKPL